VRALVVALLLGGCSAGTRSPVGAVRALAEAAQAGDRAEVWRLVLGETLTLVAAGILAGIPVAMAAARLIAGFLYGVRANDAAMAAASAAFLLAIGTLAGYVPARRASRIDPMTALRQE